MDWPTYLPNYFKLTKFVKCSLVINVLFVQACLLLPPKLKVLSENKCTALKKGKDLPARLVKLGLILNKNQYCIFSFLFCLYFARQEKVYFSWWIQPCFKSYMIIFCDLYIWSMRFLVTLTGWGCDFQLKV